MTRQEFQKSVGGVHALVMECTHKMSEDGRAWEPGDERQLTLDKALALHKTGKWKPKKGFAVPLSEAKSLNAHFKKQHAAEQEEKPKKIAAKLKSK